MLKNENRPKRGRPPKDNKRDIGYRIRLTMEEKQMLAQISERTGLTKADVIRKALFAYYEKGEQKC